MLGKGGAAHLLGSAAPVGGSGNGNELGGSRLDGPGDGGGLGRDGMDDSWDIIISLNISSNVEP